MAPSKHSHRAIGRSGRRTTTSPIASSSTSSVTELADSTLIGTVSSFDELLAIGSSHIVAEMPTAETVVPAPAATAPLRRDRSRADKIVTPAKAARAPRTSKARKPSKTAVPALVALRRPAAAPRKSTLRSIISVTAMAGVFAILVSTTTPATAFYSPEQIEAQSQGLASGSTASLATVEPQKVTVNAAAATAAAAGDAVARDSYEAKAVRQQITTLRGNANFDYTNNPFGSVQWPFPGTVPISSGFGSRNVCSYCSSYHLGVDFTPGSGVPIQSVADGVVSQVNISGGGLGNNVMIDHVINGQRVQSVYAHMQWGSIQVAVGQQVSVGTTIGAVGSTGNSTGAHLHLEIHLDGTPVDPYAWLKANAN
ncbi:peptidoglycan DD-metalloendopeptidase family protein [Salinibacterium hongtaonis]|uniref:peptidoglycan DD-metalloendopeptidase family protein n=1 Tax=Homoserinimonas hongtaonis TaxID=2079791 RepID=UPI000D38A59A|nr:peptidoglycan DD-metalloendopeptidase family protein [Salinibacterium hongtaonis]AWB88313.1 M23 family peptidase [Salinibacterium hongtaonis]